MGLSPVTERRIATYVPPLLVAALLIPFALRQNSWYEWQTAYWLLQRQAEHVSAHGVPTYLLHTSEGGFYPFFVFYGGFTIGLLAYPAALFGAWPVFLASMVAAMVCGYLGIWWTARNLGLSRRLAVLPAMVYATTPGVLSDAYGRGAWAEFIAVNAIAVMLGAWTALLRPGPGPRTLALLGLVASAAILAGTHNVTLLMTAVVLPLVALALLPMMLGRAERLGLRRRLGGGVIAVALGVGLTGAWLVPNLWLAPDTAIATSVLNKVMLADMAPFAHITNVLAPWPVVPDSFANLIWTYAQAPVYAIGWVLVAFAAVMIGSRRGMPRGLLASSVALLAVGAGLLMLIVHPLWWLRFPPVAQTVQMPIRLLPHLAVITAVSVAALLIGLRQRRAQRPLVGVLCLVVVVAQALIAIYVVTSSEPAALGRVPILRHGDVKAQEEPWSFSGYVGQFPPRQFRVRDKPQGDQAVVGGVTVQMGSALTSDAGVLQGTAGVGDRLLTDVIASPLVHVSGGVKVVGRTSDGVLLIEVTRTNADSVFTASVRAQCALCLSGAPDAPWQLRLGRLLTLLSAALLVTAGITSVRRRRRAAYGDAGAAGQRGGRRAAVGRPVRLSPGRRRGSASRSR